MTAALLALVVTVVVALGWRSWLGPAAGALCGVLVLAVSGAVGPPELADAGRALWRPFVSVTAIMTMTACAQRLGLLDRLAHVIEPRTRGPVRHAFRVVFVLSALAAALLSNDAAVLLLTPAVIALLRQVYPKRHPKFLVPFAFAVFVAAGVAPLVISNPMNLIVADRAGISFNRYALRMIPVAAIGCLVSYAVLRWLFRRPLADEAPALGAAPPAPPPMSPPARAVLVILAVVLLAYPIASLLEGPLWAVAAGAAALCVVACAIEGIGPRAVGRGVSWELLPFLFGLFVVARGLERAGLARVLGDLYRATSHPIATIGVVSAVGSALLNNHPMALLNVLALAPTRADELQLLAALVGGDLGPRLLPMGSLAGLLWLDVLRRHGVRVEVAQFVRVGVVVLAPSLTASLLVLWLFR